MDIDDDQEKQSFEVHVDDEVQQALKRSVLMKHALDQLFNMVGFDPALITQHGAVLLDIGAGSDVVAGKI